MKNFFTTLVKYLLIFVVVYVAVNLWRSPSTPARQADMGIPSSFLQTSQQEPVLVYFWGTWCGICRLTSPNVNEMHLSGYPVLGIAVSSGTTDELNNYLQQHDYRFANLNDEYGQLFADWQGQVTPSFIIIKDGQVSQSFTGITPLWLMKARMFWASI
ncbi:protein disulfide oxidoreductase [Moraxella sp.]|uniref:protein disulfide oxidoreductase n=1 Tax=Moraxella sp. TaxID=479 RepID=UPI0026DD0AE9|nr:protein disulfide oxidoreductase [Moraxella sp.]MDO4894076.1 protein disulfide oxidoreductase [Moraxella sp.]